MDSYPIFKDDANGIVVNFVRPGRALDARIRLKIFTVVGQFEFRVQASACFVRRINVRSKLKLEL